MTAVRARFRATIASLEKHRNYRLYFAGQCVSARRDVDAGHRAAVARARGDAHAGRRTASSSSAATSPMLLFGLFSGTIADRFDYRRLVIATQVASMLIATALAVLTHSGSPPLWAVFVLAALGGLVFILDAPTRQALTFQLVGPDDLPNAVALNATIFNVARILGPATQAS